MGVELKGVVNPEQTENVVLQGQAKQFLVLSAFSWAVLCPDPAYVQD